MRTEALETTRTACWQASRTVAQSFRKSVEAREIRSAALPGDIYLDRRTADFPLEWLVIEADLRRRKVVPIDTHPLVGSHDLELPSDSLDGPRVVRCDFDVWIDARSLEPGLYAGSLRPDLLLQVCQRRHDTADTDEATRSQLEVDGDPEYEEWRQTMLRPALRALEDRPQRIRFSGSGGGRRTRRWLPVLAAASLLMFVGLHDLSPLARLPDLLMDDHGPVATATAREVETRARFQQVRILRRAKESLEAEIQAQVLAAGVLESQTRNLLGRVHELEGRLAQVSESRAVINVRRLVADHRFRSNGPGISRTRSDHAFRLGDASQLLLEVEVVDPMPYSTYRVCLELEGGDGQCHRGLLLQDGRWLRLSLPVEHLRAREVGLTLSGERRGVLTELEERYALRIEP